MTAAVYRSDTRPRRVGMKILTAVLTTVCAIELLIAFEQIRPPSEWRVAQEASPTLPDVGLPVLDIGPWLSGARDSLAGVFWPKPVLVADPGDALLIGRFTTADPGVALATAAFADATMTLDDETLRTRPWRIASGRDGAVRGWTFARRLAAAPDAQIELREIVPADADQAVSASPLCAGRPPGVVALLHRQDQVDLMLFRAGATPGPDAPPDALCGSWTLRRE